MKHGGEEEIGLTRSIRWRMMSTFRARVKTFINTGFDDCENIWMYDLKDLHILHQRKTTRENPIENKKDGDRFLDRYT